MNVATSAERTLMFQEAASAGDAVERQFGCAQGVIIDILRSLAADPPSMVVTCARGSSDHAATFAKYAFERQLGWVTASAAPSISSIYQAPLKLGGSLFLAISQSGKSPDLLEAVERASRQGARTLALVNAPDTPLSKIADWTLPLCAGPENSVAATKSYIASLAAIARIVGSLERNDGGIAPDLAALPGLLRAAWRLDWSPMVAAFNESQGLFVLGRGPGLAIAQEAALKFKETCGIHAEAFSTAEVRHGPMALAATGLPMLIFRQDDESASGVDALIKELLAIGAKLLVAGPGPCGGAINLPVVDAPAALQPMLQIQSFYKAISSLAISRGHDPDRPPLLRKVTETV
ncbi:SIS domain-containing protein [Sphingopyxis indica]|uniref:SIS domain-containing protein n=1 Tax=Sphingopyxis indica TaxID=436663 RepID=UPI0029394483|nr:SIS domain-containing protein [Sphingopyxis indica]WOF42246.1 SIS domain-containing protein [Sphingopyxis indica]